MLNRNKFLRFAFELTLVFSLLSSSLQAQYRSAIDTGAKYDRSNMLIQNGGCVYNVKNPPGNQRAARGNGTTDDTRALKDAYTFVLNRMNVSGKNYDGNYIIYLPAGVYLVSDTITYNGPTRFSDEFPTREDCHHIHIVGERRATTTIRLKPNSPGFTDASNPKPVVAFARSDSPLSNWVGYTTLRNIRIHCTGNRGAIGVEMWGANTSRIQNVEVLANQGRGHIGIHFRRSVTHGYFSDILIKGFDYGVKVEMNAQNNNLRGRASHTTLEHITCEGSRTAAISVETCSATIRKLRTINVNRAITLDHNSAQVILLDSNLDGTSNASAMQINGNGHLFARNVTVNQFTSSVRQGSTVRANGNISEYTSYPLQSTRGNRGTYAALIDSIRDVPIVDYTPSSDWAFPRGLNNTAVQNALDAGKKEVYFPSTDTYDFGTVNVPRGVERINGMFQELRGTIVIDRSTMRPLVIQDTDRGNIRVINRTNRPIIFESANSLTEIQNDGTNPEQRWYTNNAGQFRTTEVSNCEVYSRSFNQEGLRRIEISDCTWVIMGWKGERHTGPSFEISGGSDVAVLGTTAGVKMDDYLLSIQDNSRVTFIGANSANYDRVFAIQDVLHGRLQRNEFPVRFNSFRHFYTFSAH